MTDRSLSANEDGAGNMLIFNETPEADAARGTCTPGIRRDGQSHGAVHAADSGVHLRHEAEPGAELPNLSRLVPEG